MTHVEVIRGLQHLLLQQPHHVRQAVRENKRILVDEHVEIGAGEGLQQHLECLHVGSLRAPPRLRSSDVRSALLWPLLGEGRALRAGLRRHEDEDAVGARGPAGALRRLVAEDEEGDLWRARLGQRVRCRISHRGRRAGLARTVEQCQGVLGNLPGSATHVHIQLDADHEQDDQYNTQRGSLEPSQRCHVHQSSASNGASRKLLPENLPDLQKVRLVLSSPVQKRISSMVSGCMHC